MIKRIEYSIGISKLGFQYSDFINSNNLELVIDIKVDAIFEYCIIKDIKVYYVRYGFCVELDLSKLSSKKGRELEDFINCNRKFIGDFEEFKDHIMKCKKYGGSS